MANKQNSSVFLRLSHAFRANAWVLPWASLTWGLASGVMISRDYQRSGRLVAFTFALVVFSAALSLWFQWEKKAVLKADSLGKFAQKVQNKAGIIEWLGITATQLYVQYILMFCLPLLFFAKAFWCFSLTILCVGSTLWDPWWVKLVKHGWYRASVRSWSMCLATSFLFPLFFARFLEHYYWAMAFLALAITFPYPTLFRPRSQSVFDVLPCAVIIVLIATMASGRVLPRFPLLAVWLKDPQMAFSDDSGASFSDPPIESPLARSILRGELAAGLALCCITPVVAPGTLNVQVFHEWTVDGVFLERIALPEIKGSTLEASFRTYSCKRNFPALEKAKKLGCRTFLQGNVEIGQVETTLK